MPLHPSFDAPFFFPLHVYMAACGSYSLLHSQGNIYGQLLCL